ncbi:ATP-grasp domain-containing protein [Labrys neptuniae]|uniref:Tetratricopeptide repeat protein n=1 Tax=Labrys neptuniae TaxID=376174 RepID=A0ABV3PT32_9HYPH
MSAPSHTDRDKALALHRNGQIEQAIAAYTALLTHQPDSADILGLLGVANEQVGHLDEAERLLRLSLLDRRSVPLAYRNLNNLLGLLIESARQEEAKAAAETYSPCTWPTGRVPDAVEHGTIVSLVSALKDIGLANRALATGFPLLSTMGEDVEFALLIAEMLHDAGRNDEAFVALDRDFGPGEELPNLHAVRAALAHERDDRAACGQSSQRFVASMPILLAEAASSQQFVLAVFNRSPEFIADFRQPYDHHYSGNFPSQLAQVFADRFRFMSILADSPTAADALRGMPRPALALNNVVNAEQLMVEDTLQRVGALEDSLGIKVINHPKLAVQATRQKNSERFANIPGIIFPKVYRYQSGREQRPALIEDIENRCGYPAIIRTVFQQMGAGTWRIDDRQALHEALEKLDGLQFYAITYAQTRHADGRFRALRAAFVNKQPLVVRADYSDHWNVRARRTPGQQAFYRENPRLLEIANRIVLDPERELGRNIYGKLRTIAEVMPLEIFGMDFDLTEDGNLLIFEINATMNLLSTSPDGFEYPRESEKKLLHYIEDFFLQKTK